MDWKKWKTIIREQVEETVEENVETKGKSYAEMKQTLDDLRNSTFIYFDTETMGFDPKTDQITQLGYQSLVFQDGKWVEKEEKNIYAELTPKTWDRLDKDSEEYRNWAKSKEREVRRIETNPKLSDEEKKQKIDDLLDPRWVLRFTGIMNQDNELVKSPDMTEKQMLQEFLMFVKSFSNPILVAHNANFDMKMVNGRNAIYGLEQLVPGQNVRDVLDTLAVSRDQFLPALLDMKLKFQNELKSMEGFERLDKMFSAGEEKTKDELASLDVPFHPEADLNDLSNKVLVALNKLPEEKREKALRVMILNTLITSLNNTYQEGRSTLGKLANSFKIEAGGAHDAIFDVKMMIRVYNSMYRVLEMAIDYLKDGAEALTDIQRVSQKLEEARLNEMEPYQKKMFQKHPKWKMKLIGKGKVKDKSTPYKDKPSMERSKSAPPGGALEEMSAMGAGAVAGYAAPFGAVKRPKNKRKQ